MINNKYLDGKLNIVEVEIRGTTLVTLLKSDGEFILIATFKTLELAEDYVDFIENLDLSNYERKHIKSKWLRMLLS